MSTPSTGQELQQVFGKAASHPFNPYSKHVFSKLHDCHTAAIGVHTYRCNDPGCNHLHHQYHSCGNRHCPNCGGLKKEQWIENLTADLLPTAYYHVVFTLPHELHPIILGNRTALFKLLFDAASQTLLQFALDPKYLGGKCSITTVLHTWGQQLGFHPHLHCIVSGGGVNADNKWVAAKRKNDKFLFPVGAMKPVFKAIFLKGLRLLIQKDELQIKGIDTKKIIEDTGYKKWKVHANSPFGSVAGVVEYLGRYTHKVAITAQRILHIDNGNIIFKYKDYADGNKQKIMTLPHAEFLSRFEQHILPKGFAKIRHSGYLHAKDKMKRIVAVCSQLQLPAPMQRVHTPVALRLLLQTGKDITLCPVCKHGKMELVATFIYHHGCLVDAAQLRNRGSPKMKSKKN